MGLGPDQGPKSTTSKACGSAELLPHLLGRKDALVCSRSQGQHSVASLQLIGSDLGHIICFPASISLSVKNRAAETCAPRL